MADILGIKLTDLASTDIIKSLDFFLMEEKSHFITTPNPEIILTAGHDEEYFFILNVADLSIADGFGLVLAGYISGQKINRVTGADITKLLLQKANDSDLKVLVINLAGGLSTKDDISSALQQKWSKLNFKVIDTTRKERLSAEENKQIADFAPQIIFVGLGAPFQEKLIYHELTNWPSSRIAIGIGGSFDFITGKIKRAPRLIRAIGLEWLWRVAIQPQNRLKRLKRIWQATVVFMSKIVKNYFINTFLYRHNVACLLYKKENGKYKFLIVQRTDDPTHWQLPQGGTDGQKLAKAGRRELTEEIGTTNFTDIKTFPHVYKYHFKSLKPAYRGYKGQEQGLFIAEYHGTDEEIKINYWDHAAWQWVEQEKIINAVHLYRQAGMKKFLEKFEKISK
ncbi:MAG: WecB/TagA/CpsF family glycosyltransferase [Patescibacteria group bacterium]